jgi:hypothetical protein
VTCPLKIGIDVIFGSERKIKEEQETKKETG